MGLGRLAGKTAVVSGCAQGAGLAIARVFADEGARVLGIDVNGAKLTTAFADLGDQVITLAVDVSVEEAWNEVATVVKKEFGELDILVNNAGIIVGKDLLKISTEEYLRTIAIDQNSVFYSMRALHPLLKKNTERAASAIVNISSVGGMIAGPSAGNDPGYNGAKAAVRNLTKNAAWRFAPEGIRVNSVHPAGIDTDMTRAYLEANPEAVQAISSISPLPPHLASPEDIAYLCLFLASDESKAMSGSEVVIDCAFMTH
jgi:NAD(P)-dependent dehydrogenase (short-subunit alcohol dehydrogenase family)